MALSAGYITQKQTQIWDLKKKGIPESDIARKLQVTRQTVHKAVGVANNKIAQALVETAKLNKIKVRNIDNAKGILSGYSSEFRTPAVITFSARNGVQVWYKYEGDCKSCDLLETCRKTLLTEMEDRNICPNENIKLTLPSKLAEQLFKKILRE